MSNSKAQWMTAKEMALTSHNLSRDGMTATRPDGTEWKWSEHFNVWAGPFPKSSRRLKKGGG